MASQYNLSMMTQLDEFDSDKFINMNFIEFLEALCRVAENMQVCHIIDDAELMEEEVIAPEVKKSWG